MKPSGKNKTRGTFKEAKGKVKETAGRATRSQRLAGRGRAEAVVAAFNGTSGRYKRLPRIPKTIPRVNGSPSESAVDGTTPIANCNWQWGFCVVLNPWWATS